MSILQHLKRTCSVEDWKLKRLLTDRSMDGWNKEGENDLTEDSEVEGGTVDVDETKLGWHAGAHAADGFLAAHLLDWCEDCEE